MHPNRGTSLAALLLPTLLLIASTALAHTADSWEEARALAAEYDAPIVIDFYADW